jgi:hypothetical protein
VRSKSTLTQVPNIYNNIRSASNVKPAYQPGLHQHRAPSTPGVNITPDAFLPANDPRKGLDLAGSNTVDIKNAPALSTPKEQTLNLTPVEVEEIKRLRLEDPAKWTRGALAEKFGVSGFTISLVSDVEKGWKKEMDGRLQHIKNRWNKGRAQARRDREKRKVDWYRDE